MVDFGTASESRGVPRNLDAERSVLGALLLDSSTVADVAPLLGAGE